jgi:hypothetical protein
VAVCTIISRHLAVLCAASRARVRSDPASRPSARFVSGAAADAGRMGTERVIGLELMSVRGSIKRWSRCSLSGKR